MLKTSIIFFVSVTSIYADIFDMLELEDPIMPVWNLKYTNSRKQQECLVKGDGTMKKGICKHASSCLLSGGTPNGFCGILSTCCTYERSCGKSTKSKISYFEAPSTFDSRIFTGGCDYKIELENSNICQIRLDFERFSLKPATIETHIDGNSYTYTSKCHDDSFFISNAANKIPTLCGNNNGQHLYIHLNSPNLVNSVLLHMKLSNRLNNEQAAEWKIRITQLECPGDNFNLFEKQENNAKFDFPLLAPKNALQYYYEMTGTVKSFGFDEITTRNSYTDDEFYAIAFRKSSNVCGVKFNVETFKLPATASAIHNDATCANGYLFIPELSISPALSNLQYVAKICGQIDKVKDGYFKSTPPGPLTIHFKSYPYNGAPGLTAFHFTYELMTSC